MMDKSMYKKMITGIPANFNVASKITDDAIITYRISFPLKPKVLNLRENKGNSATNKNDIRQQKPMNNHGFKKSDFAKKEILCGVIPENNESAIRGIEEINIALAGVGSPIKDSVWRGSLLNFARRKAEKTGISSPAYPNSVKESGAITNIPGSKRKLNS